MGKAAAAALVHVARCCSVHSVPVQVLVGVERAREHEMVPAVEVHTAAAALVHVARHQPLGAHAPLDRHVTEGCSEEPIII